MEYPNSIYTGTFNGGHIQGIALDKKRGIMYCSYTTMLVKIDLEGKFLGSVINLKGHLGCIDFCEEDGCVYGSLEYKNDAIGQGIHARLGMGDVEEGFYIARFDGEKITSGDVDASGLMETLYLKNVVEDYLYTDGALRHRYGCSGIDGTCFAPFPGECGGKKYLSVAYGIYSDLERDDNDNQIILQYDLDKIKGKFSSVENGVLKKNELVPYERKYAVFTGNTNYGVQNLEYDANEKTLYLSVYYGKKPKYENFPLFAVDMTIPATDDVLEGEKVKRVACRGLKYYYGMTGMESLDDGRFYISYDKREALGWSSDLRLVKCKNGEFTII